MIGASILGFLSGINLYSGRLDEDFVDRMNNMWSAYLMIVFAIVISAKQMFGNAISCWFPAQFPKPWVQYAENYCWVKNTYFVQTNSTIPQDAKNREVAELSYYQWVPFVLAIQALLFYIPAMVWRLLNWQTGVNIEGLLKIASDIKANDAAGIDRVNAIIRNNVAYSSTKSKRWSRQALRILICFNGNQRFGSYICITYLFIKCLYLANVIGQFYLVRAFIGMQGHDHEFFGITIISEIFKGNDWHVTGHFPRITLCDFTIRSLGNFHKYSVQCVLPVNMLNEKIYIFVFYWLLFMATLTALSVIFWGLRIFMEDGATFLKKYIPDAGDDYTKESKLSELARKDLKRDGLFILRLMGFNAGEVVTNHIIKKLWNDKNADTPDEEQSQRTDDDLPMKDNPKIYPSDQLEEMVNP